MLGAQIVVDPRGRGPSHAQSPSRSQSTGELLCSQEAKRVQDNVMRKRVPWRGRNTGKRALSFDESEEHFTAEKAGHSGRGDRYHEPKSGAGAVSLCGEQQASGPLDHGTSSEQADTGGRWAEILRDSTNMGRR